MTARQLICAAAIPAAMYVTVGSVTPTCVMYAGHTSRNMVTTIIAGTSALHGNMMHVHSAAITLFVDLIRSVVFAVNAIVSINVVGFLKEHTMCMSYM